MLLFSQYKITIKPPLKLDPSGDSMNGQRMITDFLGRRVKNFRKVSTNKDFENHFSLIFWI